MLLIVKAKASFSSYPEHDRHFEVTSDWPFVEEKLPSYQYELSVTLNYWLSPQHDYPYTLMDSITFAYHQSYDLQNPNQ